MISFSILLNCRILNLQESLAFLAIAPSDISSYNQESPDFLPSGRNGALASATAGDFTDVADIFLFDYETTKLDAVFSDLSRQGTEVAMPVPDDPDPEVYWYWQMGNRRKVRVVDLEGRLELLDPLAGHGPG